MFSFGFIEALGLKGILNLLKKQITSAVECTDETVVTFAMRQKRAMVQYYSYSLCLSSDEVSTVTNNHQGLLWNVHCVSTVVLRLKQVNFKILKAQL